MRHHPLFHRPAVLRRASGVAAALLAGGVVQAQEAPSGPVWTFGGYGSLGIVHADYQQADFVTSILKPDGVGRTRSYNLSNDSRIAAQLGLKLDRKWSAVVQVLLERRYDYSYKPIIEWGNVKYQATPDLALRVGRIALPIFIGAEYRKVGYAYPWVRTPIEIYSGVPITNSDGADLSYRWRAGGMKHVTQVFYGGTEITLTDTTSVKARGLAGVTHTAEMGALSMRASAFSATVNTNIARPLFDGFRQFGPAGIAIAERYDVIDKRVTAATLGFNYDPGNWFLMSEVGYMNGHSFLAKTHALYASAGYRAGSFTPYATYSMVNARDPNRHPGLPSAGLPPPYAVAVGQLNAGLNQLLLAIPTQDTWTAGVRWDFLPSMALKVQYDRVTPRDGSRGTLINSQPGFRSGRPVHVTSAVLDFVF